MCISSEFEEGYGVYHRRGSFYGHPKMYPVEKYVPAYKDRFEKLQQN